MKKMMSKKMKGLFSAALVLCMMLTLFSLGAYAANANVSCTLNQDVGSVVIYKGTSNIQSCSYNGSIPSGLQLSYIGADIYLAGTPTSTGNYSSEISMVTDAGNVSFTLTIAVSEAIAPAPTQTPVQTNQKPVITKNPTGETVEVGGTAQFVARAEGATSFVWRIVSADTTNTVTANEAGAYFGVTVSGQDTERLTLSNIPKSMNGWAIECKFTNAAGSSYTTGAILTVTGGSSSSGNSGSSNNSGGSGSSNTTNTDLKAPTISSQPKGAQLSSGEKTTLSVTASAPATGTLTYQWYISDTTSMSDIKAIDGANSASYTPTQTEGTKYYCVGVWVSKDGQKSTTTYSPLVEVNYSGSTGGQQSGELVLDDANSTSSPGATATPTANPSPTVSPTSSPEADNGNYDRGNSSTLIFYIVVAGLALLAVGGILIYLIIVNSRRGKGDDD